MNNELKQIVNYSLLVFLTSIKLLKLILKLKVKSWKPYNLKMTQYLFKKIILILVAEFVSGFCYSETPCITNNNVENIYTTNNKL